MKCLSSILFVLPSLAIAAFPLPHTNVIAGMDYTNVLGQQYYSAIVERAEGTLYYIDDGRDGGGTGVVDYIHQVNPWGGIDSISYSNWTATSTSRYSDLSSTYSVYGGLTNSPANTGQWWSCYLSVSIPSPFEPFVYTVTNFAQTVTTTNIPILNRGLLASMDNKLMELIPYYMQDHVAGTNGSFATYLASLPVITNSVSGRDFAVTDGDLPFWNMPDICFVADIGFCTNRQTNAFGVTTNLSGAGAAEGYFTRTPAMTSRWVILEVHEADLAWAASGDTHKRKNFSTKYYDAVPARISLTSTGSYSMGVTLSGLTIDRATQVLGAAAEDASVTAGGSTDLTSLWYSITGVAATNPAISGDVLTVSYEGEFALYGTQPYILYAEDYVERIKVLDKLRWFGRKWNQGDSYGPGETLTNYYELLNEDDDSPGDYFYKHDTWAEALAAATNEVILTSLTGNALFRSTISSIAGVNTDLVAYAVSKLATSSPYSIVGGRGYAAAADMYLIVDRRCPHGRRVRGLSGGGDQWIEMGFYSSEPWLSSAFDLESPITLDGAATPGAPWRVASESISAGSGVARFLYPDWSDRVSFPDDPFGGYWDPGGFPNELLSGRGYWISLESTVFVIVNMMLLGGSITLIR